MTRLYRLALAATVATLLLIVVGGVARLHPAGAGCGNDWPLCNGQWLPPLAWDSLIEYLHRLVALAVVVLTTLTAAVALFGARVPGKIKSLASAAFATIVLQVVIGGLTARWGAPAGIATLHLLLAMLFFGFASATLATTAAQRGSPAWLTRFGGIPAPTADRPLAIGASLGAIVAFLLVLFGASTSATGAFACGAWPLCGDNQAATAPMLHLGYRATAILGTLAAGSVLLLAWRRHASLTTCALAGLATGLVVVQSALNALATLSGDPRWISSPHLFVASLIWIAMLGAALSAWGPRPARVFSQGTSSSALADREGATHPPMMEHAASSGGTLALSMESPALEANVWQFPLANMRRAIVDYIALTKPGIMSLLLMTTFCAMLVAQRGLPPFWLVAVTLLGGVLASGGANVLNCYIDRDIDGQMSRTRNRAIVAGRVSADAALAYGISLTVAAVLLLGMLVNWTAAALALAGNLFYVLVYTKWLKRSTPYNIVIGGAAGAAPPLVGWAAVTGNLSPLAWGLFAIIFAWTPPHFWALALLKQGEYTRAAVPMLPVVRGEAETRRQIVIYTVLLALVCLAIWPLGLGTIYLVAALILNGIFLAYAIRLYRDPSKRVARQMFFYSLWYLALLFAAAVIDRIVLA